MPQSEFWPFTKTKAVEDDDFSGDSSVLQKQLGDMEGEVKEIQMELAAIKKGRLARNLCKAEEPSKFVEGMELQKLPKVTVENDTYGEILRLREELIRAKNNTDEERFQKEKYEEQLKDLEHKLNRICCANEAEKDLKPVSEDEVSKLKSKNRELQEENDELRTTLTEKCEQLQDYRVKYLQAQQQVEELKRQLDLIEFDNKTVTDQIQVEIQKMKLQFQEKLSELSPLPDMLKGSQLQLQEAKQFQKLAEESSRQLSNELQRVKEKLVIAVNNLNQEKIEKTKVAELNVVLKASADDKHKEVEAMNKLVDELKCKITRYEEKLTQIETRYKEKSIECSQLLKELQDLRSDNGRSLTRAKERSESMRRYLQSQITELERQLIQSRAQCRACQKERDEIRQKMQIQINNLQESFELGEIRLRTLQHQVVSLKNSYTAILGSEEDGVELSKITS